VPARAGRKKQGMSRFWRWIAPVAVAGGLIVASGAIPAEAASPAAYGVTINATSPHYPNAVHGKVDGFALVIYKARRGVEIATISGSVTGAASADKLTLLAEPFGSTTFSTTGKSLTLNGSSPESYSFFVAPSLATKYRVRVSTGLTPDVTSTVQTVYVSPLSGAIPSTKCSHGHCKVFVKVFTLLPASAFRTESGKKWYVYFVYDPRLRPFRFLPLDTHAQVSRAHKINGSEYEITINIPFNSTLRNAGRFAFWAACTKDTVTRDGMGLPGHHGCGDRRVSVRAAITYLG
jgi:hypothetical protein